MQNRRYMKTTIAVICAALMPIVAMCKPGPNAPHNRPSAFRPSAHHRAPMPPSPRIHHHHHSGAFWTGLGVGVIGGLAIDAFRPAPVVAMPPPPVVIRNPVWVPPVYETRPVYDAYGRIIRYEQVLVREGYWR